MRSRWWSGCAAKQSTNGVDYIHNQVVAMDRVGDRVAAIHLGTGETITAGVVVDAAGTRAAQVARMAGVDLPIEARRRYTYIFSVDTPFDQDLPLTIDPTGVHMRSYGRARLPGRLPTHRPRHRGRRR